MRRPVLYIITTANSKTGWGHLSRCINIAKIAEPYFKPTFILRKTDPDGFKKAQQNNLLIIDESAFLNTPAVEGDTALIDDYSFNKVELEHLKKRGFITIEINDIPADALGADILINQTPGLDVSVYSKTETKTYLLGSSYLLINPLFYEDNTTVTKIKKSILVLIGATDPLNISDKIVLAATLYDREFHFLKGGGAESQIKKDIDKRFHFYRNLKPQDVRSLMLSCEAVITTASTSALEAICCGCAVFAGTVAKNQAVLAQYLKNSKLIFSLGDLQKINWQEGLDLINENRVQELMSNTQQFRLAAKNNLLANFFERLSKGNLWT